MSQIDIVITNNYEFSMCCTNNIPTIWWWHVSNRDQPRQTSDWHQGLTSFIETCFRAWPLASLSDLVREENCSLHFPASYCSIISWAIIIMNTSCLQLELTCFQIFWSAVHSIDKGRVLTIVNFIMGNLQNSVCSSCYVGSIGNN